MLQTVRKKLYEEISKINKDRDWSFILKQIGESKNPAIEFLPGSLPWLITASSHVCTKMLSSKCADL